MPSSSRSASRPRDIAAPRISVVVPTCDRPEALQRCLDTLAAQTVVDQLEVIVVDDGSVAGASVEEVVAQYPFARLIRKRNAGPASARNAGVASSRGDYVCLTDDDCEASPAWAERLVRAIESGADAVAGVTVTGGRGSLGAAADLIAGAPALVGSRPAGELVFAPSNNVACRAQLLVDIPFDERFPVAAGEDREWCRRILQAGCVLRLEPAAVLLHRPESTLRAFLRQQVRYGRGAFWFRRRGPEPQRLESMRFYWRLLARSFHDGLLTGVLVALAQAATAVGFFLAWAGDRDR